MTRKTRSSTICEWALGVSVEEYCNSVDRRKSRKSSGRQRISVEISTDDESEEDTVKITYPRANFSKNSNGHFPGIKKVRFDKLAPKSALRTADADVNSEDNKNPAKNKDTSEPESEPKSKKKKGDNSAKKKKKVVECSPESEESETETTETDTETDESEEEVPPPPKKNKDVDASKKQEKTKDTKKSSKKSNENTAPAKVELNNVGPASKRREKDTKTKKDKSRNVEEPQKLRPEAALSPHLRRPNLIMPIRAEVLQVEHTIEGVEDPRPNAFHDPQHGVLRVYHGPAYGNPYGMLYPARDPNKAPLPMGAPHPLQNPYFHGFANPTNPGDNHFRGQSPWGAVPITCMPGRPPVMAPVDPVQTQMQMPSWWGPMPPTKTGSPNGPPKPVMSGAIQGDGASTGASNKDKGWDTNVGPQQNKTPSPPPKPASPNNVAPVSPINTNLTVNPNTPWAAFASDISKKSTPNKNGPQTNGGGSNGSKKSWGSKKITDWQPIASGQHPDLGWGTPTKRQGSIKGSKSAWAQTGGENTDSWGATGGSGSNRERNTSGNSQNNDARATSGGDGWATANSTTWGNSNNNQAAVMHNDGWGAPNDQSGDVWANNVGNYNNWSTGSTHSGSKKSNRSQNGGGQAQPATDWDGQGNNVGYSGRAVSNGSNKSSKSKRNTPPPSTNGGWDNNAGPTTNSPVGDPSNKGNGSKHDSKKASNNGDVWATGSNSAWTTDNNAGPTNSNSPNNPHTSKKSSDSGHKGGDQWTTTAGGGAGWGPETTSGDNWNPTATEMSKASSGSKSMPGAWDNTPPWGDTSMAQSTGGAADNW
ncbi:hypothetical protein CI238_04700 [Colletotrichum incanum]|uniref:Uncharacterized protein n=1 Tax=Colletotrichum incanum TaxID=1573173 RepID=A0A166PQC9_COLIC|nr:hypothetical protein CI238_04700 [Colletotrichum incanum]OHW95017.1 hypothetical protein CSPAE12_06287 [Colletotrichum incanum]